jgi:hypothetical protein
MHMRAKAIARTAGTTRDKRLMPYHGIARASDLMTYRGLVCMRRGR